MGVRKKEEMVGRSLDGKAFHSNGALEGEVNSCP
jgi:hypothetical protein